MCLKFDHHLIAQGKLRAGKSPYFCTALVFYLVGLTTTMAVMHVFKAAQPALLYLSPAGILSVLLTALVRGEVKEMFAFSTELAPEEDAGKRSDGSDSSDSEEPLAKSTGSPLKRRSTKKH